MLIKIDLKNIRHHRIDEEEESRPANRCYAVTQLPIKVERTAAEKNNRS
jgi:hypothetical protein